MKVLYCHFSTTYHHKIIEILNNYYSWNPIYILGHEAKRNSKNFQKKFTNCFIEDQKKLRHGFFDLSMIGKYVPIDQYVFKKLSPFLINCIDFQIVDDATGFNYPFSERKRYLYDALNYWNSVLVNCEPDIIVYFTRSHTPAEYPLYLLSKYIFNKPIMIINPIPLFDNNYHFISSSNDTNPLKLIENYKSKKYLLPNDEILEYFDKIKKENIEPKYLKDFNRKKNNLINIPFNLIKEIIMGITEFNLFEKGWHMMKINNKSYSDIKSRPNRFENALNIAKISFQNFLCKVYYNKLISTPKFNNEKFVYFSASYQPEASTFINAGFFSDQFQVIDILSKTIPDDWFIYYKEHPATFSTMPGFRGSLIRNKHYYNRLKRYKNIKLISADIENVKLIDSSMFVATTGGTVGWESIIRGTPVLSFGNSWYHDCDSVFVIKTLDNAKEAINKIISGYKPSQDDILCYAASLEKISKKIVHRNFKKEIKVSKNTEKELKIIADFLYENYENNSFDKIR